MFGFYTLLKVLLKILYKLEETVQVLQQLADQQKKVQEPLTEQWLDNQEVMQQLHWSKSTLQRRRTDGTLPYTKIKGKYYYREADISKMMGPGY